MTLDPDVPILDEDALEDALERGEDMIVVYYADWCGYSRAFMPTFEDRAHDLPLPAAAANISDHEDPRWSTYGIERVPTLVAYQEGHEAARVGGRPGEGLKSEDLDRLLDQLA